MTGLSMLPSGAGFVSDGLHAVIKHTPSGSFFTLLSQELSIVRRLLDIPFNQQ